MGRVGSPSARENTVKDIISKLSAQDAAILRDAMLDGLQLQAEELEASYIAGDITTLELQAGRDKIAAAFGRVR